MRELLQDRARMLAKAREFLSLRAICEVDTPILDEKASIDEQIDLIEASVCGHTHYLHSSPEYGMKKLLSHNSGDIFQLSHVFRNNEEGSLHLPEFTMCEWYRLEFTLEELIDETIAFIELFLGPQLIKKLSYSEAIKEKTGLDPFNCSLEKISSYLREHGLEPPSSLTDREDALDLLFSAFVQPMLGHKTYTILTPFPSSQAALAKTFTRGRETLAERFEIFYQGVELANGYHELTNSLEQRKRFDSSNEAREKRGKKRLPIDEVFLNALERGLPDCCGVSVGFDRLMLLRHRKRDIHEILAKAPCRESFSYDLKKI